MYCYKCGVKNSNTANFCCKCGAKIIRKNKVNSKNNYLNITGEINFLKHIAYNKIIKSKYKYINIFLCISVFVLSIAFFTSICVGFPKSISLATDLAFNNNYFSISNNQLYLKKLLEQTFRDIWCQIILLFSLFIVIISLIIIFINLIKLNTKIKFYKNKNNF